MRDQRQDWVNAYKVETDTNGITFPSEYIIRMFKGDYPRLKMRPEGGYNGKSILDISCGSVGRDLIVFKQVGFGHIAATEISPEIVEQVRHTCDQRGIEIDARVGTNRHLPFDDETFDFLVSWNVCYYFDDIIDISQHVAEYARVLKPSGTLVFSIPKAKCFIYRDCIDKGDGYVEITNDPFKIRNGIVLKRFSGEEEIESVFGEGFVDFCFGSIDDDCFGLDYSWHIGYCRKKQNSKGVAVCGDRSVTS